MNDASELPREPQPRTPLSLHRPGLFSALVALIYFAVCAIYIALSDRWVAQIAGGTDQQLRLQTLKGTIFVALTSLLIFALTWALLRRLAQNHQALLAHEAALLQAERRATVGLLASSIAHDMNNVLTVGMANVELLRSHASLDAAGKDMLTDIGQALDRIHDMTRRMSRVHHGQQPGAAQPVNLPALIAQTINFLKSDPRVKTCSVRYVGPDVAVVPVHEVAIREALENLILNAAEATEGRGTIEVRLQQSARNLIIEVHDNGPGVPAERRQQVFEPLYSSKPNGMGLGLVAVKAAAKLHNGRAEVEDSPLGGARFRMILMAA